MDPRDSKVELTKWNNQIRLILEQLTNRNKNAKIAQKLMAIASVLLANQIDLDRLKDICRLGLPEEAGRLRVFCWMVLLGVLPCNKGQWQAAIERSQENYKFFSHEFMNKDKYRNFPYGERYSQELPEWLELQTDYQVWQQIQKDTMRTHSELSFFSGVYDINEVPFYKTGGRREKQKMIRGEQQHVQWLQTLDNRLYRYDVMSKILFVTSKFNKNLKYVQGMNQILAPIFYICNVDSNVPREAETMQIFMKVASDVMELHMKEFDKTEVGLEGKLEQIDKLTMIVDYQLWAKLKQLDIKPFFYAFRWVTMYFAQEFQLFDIIILWDHMFTIQDRYKYMDFVCLAMLECKRSVIIKNEFTKALQKLQQAYDLNVREVIFKARQLYERYRHINVEQEYQLRLETSRKIDEKVIIKKTKSKTMRFIKNLFN